MQSYYRDDLRRKLGVIFVDGSTTIGLRQLQLWFDTPHEDIGFANWGELQSMCKNNAWSRGQDILVGRFGPNYIFIPDRGLRLDLTIEGTWKRLSVLATAPSQQDPMRTAELEKDPSPAIVVNRPKLKDMVAQEQGAMAAEQPDRNSGRRWVTLDSFLQHPDPYAVTAHAERENLNLMVEPPSRNGPTELDHHYIDQFTLRFGLRANWMPAHSGWWVRTPAQINRDLADTSSELRDIYNTELASREAMDVIAAMPFSDFILTNNDPSVSVMTPEEINRWIEACNSTRAKDTLRHYLQLRKADAKASAAAAMVPVETMAEFAGIPGLIVNTPLYTDEKGIRWFTHASFLTYETLGPCLEEALRLGLQVMIKPRDDGWPSTEDAEEIRARTSTFGLEARYNLDILSWVVSLPGVKAHPKIIAKAKKSRTYDKPKVTVEEHDLIERQDPNQPVAWAYEWKPLKVNNAWQPGLSFENPLDAMKHNAYRNMRPLIERQPATLYDKDRIKAVVTAVVEYLKTCGITTMRGEMGTLYGTRPDKVRQDFEAGMEKAITDLILSATKPTPDEVTPNTENDRTVWISLKNFLKLEAPKQYVSSKQRRGLTVVVELGHVPTDQEHLDFSHWCHPLGLMPAFSKEHGRGWRMYMTETPPAQKTLKALSAEATKTERAAIDAVKVNSNGTRSVDPELMERASKYASDKGWAITSGKHGAVYDAYIAGSHDALNRLGDSMIETYGGQVVLSPYRDIEGTRWFKFGDFFSIPLIAPCLHEADELGLQIRVIARDDAWPSDEDKEAVLKRAKECGFQATYHPGYKSWLLSIPMAAEEQKRQHDELARVFTADVKKDYAADIKAEMIGRLREIAQHAGRTNLRDRTLYAKINDALIALGEPAYQFAT